MPSQQAVQWAGRGAGRGPGSGGIRDPDKQASVNWVWSGGYFPLEPAQTLCLCGTVNARGGTLVRGNGTSSRSMYSAAALAYMP